MLKFSSLVDQITASEKKAETHSNILNLQSILSKNIDELEKLFNENQSLEELKFSQSELGELKNMFSRLNDLGKQLSIFKRGQTSAAFVFEIDQIRAIEISLNNVIVCTLNEDKNNQFTPSIETDVRDYFKNEYQNKMFETTVRKITLIVIDNKNKHYVVSPYLRKGNQRLTSGKFFEVVEHLIDFCWMLNKSLHPESPEKRLSKFALVFAFAY